MSKTTCASTVQAPMTIGEAAIATGLSVKKIRHYETTGLLAAVHRSDAGYRLFSTQDVARLQFIRSARALGFSLREIEDLLALWSNQSRRSSDVKALTHTHITALDEKIRNLHAMRETLQTLANACDGDSRPDCPILQGLEASIATGMPSKHAT